MAGISAIGRSLKMSVLTRATLSLSGYTLKSTAPSTAGDVQRVSATSYKIQANASDTVYFDSIVGYDINFNDEETLSVTAVSESSGVYTFTGTTDGSAPTAGAITIVVDAPLVDISTYLNDAGVTDARSLPEDTTFDPDNTKGRVKSYAPALRDGSLSLGGPWNDDAHFFMARQMKKVLNDANGEVPHYELGEYGRKTGQPRLVGDGFVNRFEVTVDATGIGMFTGEAQMSGAPTRSTFS